MNRETYLLFAVVLFGSTTPSLLRYSHRVALFSLTIQHKINFILSLKKIVMPIFSAFVLIQPSLNCLLIYQYKIYCIYKN
jgi:hypothetical protein